MSGARRERLARLVLRVLLPLALLCRLPSLGLGLNGPELRALATAPPASPLGLLRALGGVPLEPLRLRLLALVLLLLAGLGLARLAARLFGARGSELQLPLLVVLWFGPWLAELALDLRGLSALAGLALGSWALLGLLVASDRQGPLRGLALLALVPAGLLLGWPAAPLAALLLARPYRDRRDLIGRTGRAWALGAGLALAVGAGLAWLAPTAVSSGPLLGDSSLQAFLLPVDPSWLPLQFGAPGQLVILALVPLAFFLLRRIRLALALCLAGALCLHSLPGPGSASLAAALLSVALGVSLGQLADRLHGRGLWATPALAPLLLLALSSWTLGRQLWLARLDLWRGALTSAITLEAQAVAATGADSDFIVLAPLIEVGGQPGFGPDMAFGLRPPLANFSVPVEFVATEDELRARLLERRETSGALARALLVLHPAPVGGEQQARSGQAPALPDFEPLAPLRPAGASEALARTGVPLEGVSAAGGYRAPSPLPAHGAAALGLRRPAEALVGELRLQLGAPETATHTELRFALNLPPPLDPSQPGRIELLLPDTLEFLLGPPLFGLSWSGSPSAPALQPLVLARPTRAALLEPAPASTIDLSSAASPPRLHLALAEDLPRPLHFELLMQLDTPAGGLSWSAAGPVPAGPPGEAWLTPQTLAPQASPQLARPWSDVLATGLSQRLVELGGSCPGQLELRLEGPAGLRLAGPPAQVQSFFARAP